MAKKHSRPKSWLYTNTLTWDEGKKGTLAAAGKPGLETSTPADFGGPAGFWTPEDFLVAAVNSCIMTTFLHYREKAGLEITAYSSTAEGELVYDKGGLRFAAVTVRPEITVAAQADVETATATLEKAESSCLISNALAIDVGLEPTVTVATGE